MSGPLLTGASHQPMVIGMICFLMAIGSMLRPRWLPQKSFPPYAYLPGREPHPLRDPTGHSYHVEPIPVAAEASLGSSDVLDVSNQLEIRSAGMRSRQRVTDRVCSALREQFQIRIVRSWPAPIASVFNCAAPRASAL